MPVTRCPKCDVPLTPEEAQGPTCPACKSDFALAGHPTTEGNQAAVGPAQGSDAGLGFVLALVGAITGGVIGVVAFGGNTWGTSILAGVGFAAGRLLGLLIPK